MTALVEFANVSVRRGDKLALDSIDLRIDVGENIAIIGPNGCGKSTLIKVITRELYPLARPGTAVRILGEERWNVFDLRAALGIVSNDLMTACTREITGRELVLSGFFSSVGIWPWHHVTEDMQSRTARALEQLEVPHLADRWVSDMSSGEARRLLIARALVHAPRALILDEPSNSLDPHAARALHETMRTLARSGTAVILVTHHLPDVIPEIGRVVLLRGGRVFRDTSKTEALRPDTLCALYGGEVEVWNKDGIYAAW